MEIHYVPQESFVPQEYPLLYDVDTNFQRGNNTQTVVVDYGRHLTRAGTTALE